MASTTRKAAATLEPTAKAMTMIGLAPGVIDVVPEFAVFIDTHRDQPHVPTFEDDLHRGWCRPTIVSYAPPQDLSDPNDMGRLVRDDGRVIDVDPKHRFVETSWWEEFVMDAIGETGKAPVAVDGEQKGQMPTSHLRDARKKVYKLKSLRQIVKTHVVSASKNGAAYAPNRRTRKGAK